MAAVATPELTATLEELITSVWAEAERDGETACPVCGGEMRLADGHVIRCVDCGSELS
jgi:tRNA(Ile2) C34 agmatinyltransferase TiaS